MSVSSGPKILNTSTFTWAMDIANYKNLDTFSSNFYLNSNFVDGAGMPQESGSNATNTVVRLANPGVTPFVLEQTAGTPYTEYQINLSTELTSSTVYCMSGWYGESSDYSCVEGSRMFHARTFSASGNHIATGIGIGTTLKTVVIDGITWRYCYELISTPSDYSNDFNWYVGYGGNTYTGKRYYTNLKMEKGTLPSIRNYIGPYAHPFAVNGCTFDFNNGIVTLDGTNDFIRIPFNNTFNVTSNEFSVIVWSRRNDSSTGYNGLISADSSSDNTWKIFKDAGESYYRVRVGNASVPINSSNGYTVGRWHQYAFTRSGSAASATIRVFQDGVQVGSSTGAISDPISFSNDLVLGSYRLNDAISGYYLMNQSFGPIYFYRHALNNQDIFDNFQALRGRFGI